MNVQVIRYLPRGERSHTRRILETFLKGLAGAEVHQTDLCEHAPEMFQVQNLLAYIRRNYLGEKLTVAEEQLLAGADRFRTTLQQADLIVLAAPMHNFSLPAVVKAWFDAVMQKGETFNYDASGYRGLLKARRTVVLYASGGIYAGERQGFDFFGPLARQEFGFMGVKEIELINAGGMNLPDGKAEERIGAAEEQAQNLAARWSKG